MRSKFLLAVLGRTVPMTLALIMAVFAPDTEAKIACYATAVCIVIVSEYFGVFKPMQNLEELRRKQLSHWLTPFVDSAEPARIRMNVMLIRRWWLRRHFFQFFQVKMAGYPDANLHFSIHKGVCGRALKAERQEVTVEDLRDDKEDWGFTPAERARLAHVQAVASVPLYQEVKTMRGDIRYRYFGVLNVDALDDIGIELLLLPETQEQILGFAKFAQLTLAE